MPAEREHAIAGRRQRSMAYKRRNDKTSSAGPLQEHGFWPESLARRNERVVVRAQRVLMLGETAQAVTTDLESAFLGPLFVSVGPMDYNRE